MSKYETLKNAVLEFTKIGDDKRLHNEMKGLIADIDRMTDNEKDEPKNLLTAAEWNAMKYIDRANLKQDSPAIYDNAIQGNFKEVAK